MNQLNPDQIRDSIIDKTHQYILNTKRYVSLPCSKIWKKLQDLEEDIDALRILLYKSERLSFKDVTTPIGYQTDVLQQFSEKYESGETIYHEKREGVSSIFEHYPE
jgi:hypothetical protein